MILLPYRGKIFLLRHLKEQGQLKAKAEIYSRQVN